MEVVYCHQLLEHLLLMQVEEEDLDLQHLVLEVLEEAETVEYLIQILQLLEQQIQVEAAEADNIIALKTQEEQVDLE